MPIVECSLCMQLLHHDQNQFLIINVETAHQLYSVCPRVNQVHEISYLIQLHPPNIPFLIHT